MKRAVLVACAFAAVAAADECWETHRNSKMPCHARNERRAGSLVDMQNACKELDDDCRGVTCYIGDDGKEVCELRHHKACEGGAFLEAAEGMTTYVKTCKLNLYNFVEHMDMYMSCYAKEDNTIGVLEERKIACAELGPNECLGVTCNYVTGADGSVRTENCTIRDFRACGQSERLRLHSSDKKEVSYEMFAKAPMPTPPSSNGEECRFTTIDKKNFGCNVDGTQTPMSLEEAKTKCLTQRASGTTFCNGVVCQDLEGMSCVTHTHCEAHHQEILVDAETIIHLTDCNAGEWCRSACWVQKEFGHHQCRTDCDCDSNRYCTAQGYCHARSEDLEAGVEVCREGDDCVFDQHEFKEMSCPADNKKMSLDEAKAQCLNMGASCGGITCHRDTKLCTVRDHLSPSCIDGQYLRVNTHQDTYVKCCGAHAEVHCPGSFRSSSSGTSAIAVLIVLALLAVVGFLAYKNRIMAKSYIAPEDFNVLPQDDDEADDDFVIDADADDMEER